jgi:hypothetical protein
MLGWLSDKTLGHARVGSNDSMRQAWQDWFICLMSNGWYIETREGEFGPYQSVGDAMEFCEKKFIARESGDL